MRNGGNGGSALEVGGRAWNGSGGGGGGGGGNGGGGGGPPLAVHLKSFITHFNHYTDERFTFLKSYILNPYHRDMTYASRIPAIGLQRAAAALQKRCVPTRMRVCVSEGERE